MAYIAQDGLYLLDEPETALSPQRQLAFLASHPEVGLLGTAAREVDVSGREVQVLRPPTEDSAIRRALIRGNPFVHSSVTMRRELVEQVGGYDPVAPVAQDYDLWMRLSRVTALANLGEVLVVRRLLPGRITAGRDTERLRVEARVRWRAVQSGAYPPWCAVYALRPALALAVPPPLRRALRRFADRRFRGGRGDTPVV